LKQQGFGLLELVVVIGIIAVLGVIALPQYNKYVTKARITEALHTGQVYARKVESEAAGAAGLGIAPSLEHGAIRKTGEGVNARVRIILSDTIDSQALIASDEADLAGGKVLELAPEGSSGTIRWACASNLPVSKMPKVCKYSADVGGPVLWADRDMDDPRLTACWDQSVADSAADGKGWVVGKNSLDEEDQDTVKWDADKGLVVLEGGVRMGEDKLILCR